ncbi:MAG: Crp/Fnr family transcriptional regulator [Bacteroidales bacterium]|nr:Crp/Fnr family transcriptional regulator [Bacteroidales bacterium]MBN2633338.1 Crp/Fnr family transcriptional regulator [Bacteroidales bacterium]
MKNECGLCLFKSGPATKLSEDEIEKLSLNCALVNVRKGDSVIRQGTFSTNVAYLRSGLAKIHIAGPYYEQIVRIVRAPSYLALPTTFGDKINQYSVTVIESSEVCFIDINVFRYLLARNPEFSYEILLEVCRNELDMYNRCANRTQKQIRGKIADVLLEMSEKIYHENTFKLPVSQEEMGNLIDSSRESVSRVIAEFIKDGIIRMKGRSVEILRKDNLKMISTNG